MRHGAVPLLLWASGNVAAESFRSLQEDASVLGNDFFISFGTFNVTAEVPENCQVEYELLTVCTAMECSNFVEVCPNNNRRAEVVAEPATCETVDATICNAFNVEGCCMTACAFEMQDLALCVGQTDFNCNVPSCRVESNNQSRIGSNQTEPVLDCARDLAGKRYTCVHISNITDGDVVKTMESTIDCVYDRGVGFDIYASEECQCVAMLTSNNSAKTQVCGCDLCPESETEFVSVDCSMSVNDPFVVGECTNQTCGGQCITKQSGDLGESTTQSSEPSTSPPGAPSLVPTSMPSVQPSAATETNAPNANAQTGTTNAPTATIAAPSSASSLTPTGPLTVPTVDPITTLLPSANATPTTTAPTSSAPSSAPSAAGANPSTKPTTWYDGSDRPFNSTRDDNNSTYPLDNATHGNETHTDTSTGSSGSHWYQHQAFITLGGAWISLCLILCLLVTSKNGSHGMGEGKDDRMDHLVTM